MSEKGSEVLKTTPFDPRFPQSNQTLNCYINYVDYHRCLDALESDQRCEYFKNVFTVLCPFAWVEKWDQQRENGTFPKSIARVPKLDTEDHETNSKKTSIKNKKGSTGNGCP